MVAITALGIEFSNRHRTQVVEQARDAAVFMAVQFDEGESRFEDRQNYEYVLSSLARGTGGLYETVLSSLGVPNALEKIAADLKSQYRLSYSSPGDVKESKIEVKVARPGARVRVGRPGTRPKNENNRHRVPPGPARHERRPGPVTAPPARRRAGPRSRSASRSST